MFTVKPHILVIDDDDRLRELLQQFLQEQGFCVSVSADTTQARHIMASIQCNLVVLDLMLPGETGLEFMDWLRERGTMPVLMLSAMGETDDRIAGLEKGVDDYLAKPFEPRELLLRIQAVLARYETKREARKQVIFGPFTFSPDERQLRQEGEPVYLTTAEAELLTLLIAHEGTALGREKLSALMQSGDNARTVDVQVNRLRRKVEQNPKQPRYIQTIRGEGYVFRAGH